MLGKNKMEVGQKFGERTFLGGEFVRKKHKYYLCECSCGKKEYKKKWGLENNKRKACRKCTDKKYKIKHELSRTPFRTRRTGMNTRCYNKNSSERKKKYYLDKGIEVERKCFEDFYNDMYESYLDHVNKHGIHNTTLDRIDPLKNYSKENCRRATREQQANNNSGTIEYKTGLSLEQLSKEFGLTIKTLRNYHNKHKNNFYEYLCNRRKINRKK